MCHGGGGYPRRWHCLIYLVCNWSFLSHWYHQNSYHTICIKVLSKCRMIWVKSQMCGCLVTWFCYQWIAKPFNKMAAPPCHYPCIHEICEPVFIDILLFSIFWSILSHIKGLLFAHFVQFYLSFKYPIREISHCTLSSLHLMLYPMYKDWLFSLCSRGPD